MADSLCGVMLEDFGTFRQQYPGITLKITAAGTQEMFRLLNHNEADLILTLDSHIYNTEYVIAAEERVPVHFVAGADCPLRFQDEVSLDSLLAHPFILTEKKMSYRRLLDEKLAAPVTGDPAGSGDRQHRTDLFFSGAKCRGQFSAGFRHRTGSAGGSAVSSCR